MAKWICACLLVATLVSLAGSVFAQHRPPEEGGGAAPISVSTLAPVRPAPAKKGAKQSQKAPKAMNVSASAQADAILGSALQELWAASDRHYHEGEYDHTINLSRIIVQGDPQNMEAFENAAYLLWSTLRNQEAIEVLKQGIQVNPKSYYLYSELGYHYLRNNKNPQAALPYLEKAVTFTCPFSTWHMLAQAYEKLNRWDKAVGAWRRAARYPNNPVAQNRLKRAQAELQRQKQ